MKEEPTRPEPREPAGSREYEPPQVEEVLTPEDLDREVQYAGQAFTGPT